MVLGIHGYSIGRSYIFGTAAVETSDAAQICEQDSF